MTTTDEDAVRHQQREPAAIRQRPSSNLRLNAAIRVAIAVLASGALTAGAIAALWTPLRAKSDTIGWPIFADFNPSNYAHAYYLAVGLFPIAALLIFFALTRIGPRLGLATPPPRGRLRPLTGPAEAEQALEPERSSPISADVAAAARVAAVGAILGLEVGVAANHLWLGVVLGAVGYSLLVGLGSAALALAASARSPWRDRLATANALGAPLTVIGLSLVSAHTEVRIDSGNAVHHYPWFPVWLALPLAAALFGWLVVSLRGATPAVTAAIERQAVLVIAAPVALFVLVAHLPGETGPLNLFEEGQSVTETMLLGHGWLPWRDVVLTHGLLGDVAPTAAGWAVFGNSYWAAYAGIWLIFYPLTVVATYALLTYLVGRNWPMLLVAALIFLGTWLGSADARFLLWPVTLLLLAALLHRPTKVRAVALGVLGVTQSILTPEMAPAVLIYAAVVAAYEWYWRPPGAAWAQAFRRTIWMAVAIVVSAGAFVIYMLIRGATGDLIYVTVALVAGHFGEAVPPNAVVSTVSQGKYDFVALAPVAAVLVSFAYAVVRLRTRRPFLLGDWPMAAVAVFVLFYYTKYLARMDISHAYQPFIVATPLIIYIVYRAVSAADRWVRHRLPERRAGWVTAHPVGIAVLVLFVVLFWAPLHTQVDATPAAYRPLVAARPAYSRVGYFSLFDGPAYQDLARIVDAYLGPHGRLLDITNEPGLSYYLLGREPSSRWYAPVGIVVTADLQRNLLAQLRRSPPKLIIFDDTDTKMIALPTMDGVPNAVELYLVSRWILQHYRPLLESHGRTIYALPGTPPVSSLHLHLNQQPATVGVPFLGQECSWGFAPTFLSGPAEPPSGAQGVPARAALVRQSQVTFTGWAGDLRAREPAREVIATFNGRIVGQSTPNIDRPDLPAAGYPSGFVRSGFQLSIPTWAVAARSLRLYAIGRDGSVAQIPIPPAPKQGGVARVGSRTVVLQPRAVTGHVDAESPSSAALQIEPPAGSTWSDYRWLEVDAPSFGGFLQGGFGLSDTLAPTAAGQLISFETLPQSPRRYIIPVSSCAQWQGFGSRRLFLASSPAQDAVRVQLIR